MKNIIFGKFTLFICIFISFIIFSPGIVYANNNADPVNSRISVSSEAIRADGLTTSTITVTVKDSLGNNLGGDHITLTSTKDTGLIINGGVVGANDLTIATDSDGKAVFRVSSVNPTSTTDTFTVTDISSNPPVALGSVNVKFTASPLAPKYSCSDGAPGETPKLISAVPNGSTKITLTWTKSTSPATHYLLAYGNKSGEYIYGNPNVGGLETTSYTVGSLSPQATYYFAIRAVNGCNPGNFSNELSATAGVIPTPTNTPTPTQEPSPTNAPTNTPVSTSTPSPTKSENLQVNTVSNLTKSIIGGSSKAKEKAKDLKYVSIFLLVVVIIGVFIYRRHKRI